MTLTESLLAALPAANVGRFTPARKAAIVDAVTYGAISVADVCARYAISTEEFAYWTKAMDKAGIQALRVTKMQHYREVLA